MKRLAGMLALAALAVQPAQSRAEGFEGTARLQLQRVVTYEGKDKGPGRSAMEAQLETCNNIRAGFFELPAQQVSESVLSRIDQQRVDHYFSNGMAATYVTGMLIDLPDLKRWTDAAAKSPDGKVQPPPDCARHAEHEQRTGTIWRKGVVWRLDFNSRRALGSRRPADFTLRSLPLPMPFEQLPLQQMAGQSCREVEGPALAFVDGRGCLWTAFPAVRYLNFPWSLRSGFRLGMPGKVVQQDTVQFAERNGTLDPGLFDIPAGFARVGPAP